MKKVSPVDIKLQLKRISFFSALTALVLCLACAHSAAAETIDDILKAPELKGAKASIVIRDLDSDEYLYDLNRGEILIPASNMKLVTGAAAILALGLNWRFSTDIHADSIGEGAAGNLYIYGHGDPTLSGEFFPGNDAAIDAFAGEIVLAGVRRISGDIILDGSLFPPEKTPAGWEAEDLNYCYAPNTSALAVAGNCPKIMVSGTSKGVAVRFDPPVPEKYVHVGVTRVWEGSSRLSVSTMEDGRLRLNGRVRSGRSLEVEYKVKNPAEFFGWALESSLERLGVEFGGRIITAERWKGDRAAFRRIARYSSVTLPGIIEEMEHESDNFVAEQLLRTIGLQAKGNATTESGSAAAVELMRYYKIAGENDLVMYDGSGLSRLNRMRPAVLDSLLATFYR
ncbi:MAG: D-alanyl-D-alanine carboxypeptidase/D-alanyl-D-alanine-endopeptidase, partial [bacterium]